MAVLRFLSLALALSCSTLALPTSGGDAKESQFSETGIFEKLNGPPAGWVRDEAADIDKDASTIRLRIHLVQENMGKFHELAAKVFKQSYCLETDILNTFGRALIDSVPYRLNFFLEWGS